MDDDDTVSANSTEYFFNYQSYSEINHDLKTNNINAGRYIFVDDKGKKLAGGEGADRLYGGAGNDILMETEYPGSDTSDDYLEGGAGNDSYYVGGGDTLFDTDRQGTVFVTRDNGMIYTLTGGNEVKRFLPQRTRRTQRKSLGWIHSTVNDEVGNPDSFAHNYIQRAA